MLIETSVQGTPQPVGRITTNIYVTGNADFGEYMEWDDNNPKNIDRVGYFVEPVNNRIRIAKSNDTCIGIISGTAGLVGDAAEIKWQGINNVDNFGRVIRFKSYYTNARYIANTYDIDIPDSFMKSTKNVISNYILEHAKLLKPVIHNKPFDSNDINEQKDTK